MDVEPVRRGAGGEARELAGDLPVARQVGDARVVVAGGGGTGGGEPQLAAERGDGGGAHGREVARHVGRGRERSGDELELAGAQVGLRLDVAVEQLERPLDRVDRDEAVRVEQDELFLQPERRERVVLEALVTLRQPPGKRRGRGGVRLVHSSSKRSRPASTS